MLEVSSILQRHSPRRLLFNNATRIFITLGGWTILIVLMLIFIYLLYVVLPIFKPVTAQLTQEWNFPEPAVRYLEIDEKRQTALRVNAKGELATFSLQQDTLDLMSSLTPVNLAFTDKPTAIAKKQQINPYWIYGFANGHVGLFQTQFKAATDPQSPKTLAVHYPFGRNPLAIAPENVPLRQVTFEKKQDKALIAALSDTGSLYLQFFFGDLNFLTGEVQWQAQPKPDLQAIPKQIDQVLIAQDVRYLFLRKENSLLIFDIQNPYQIKLKEAFELTRKNESNVRFIQLLSGSTLLAIHEDNSISQWFEIFENKERRLKMIRLFHVPGAPITTLIPEMNRKIFYTGNQQGNVDIFYTTDTNHLLHHQLGEQAIEAIGISPRQDALLIQQAGQLKHLSIDNEYPEISWHSLWSKIWYEGYNEPDFIWQSTSGSDDFEPKFSLIPLALGTFKAAFYALLFSVPLAIGGAIYTAYFMKPSLRKIVKPTIEIMEAMPTVILGFLAGLWLAPLVEAKLISILLMIVLLPVFVLLLSWLWQQLPPRIGNQLPEHHIVIFLIPIFILFCWGILSLNPWIERTFLGGETRLFLTQKLDLYYDQRNAFVVGIAMGFAVIPTIFSIAEDALFSVPRHLTQGSLALGATLWQTLSRIVLLTASPGIFSAIMMGLGRGIGETMIVLMATGNTPVMDLSIFQGMRTLSANIAVEMPEAEIGSSHYRILFLTALVLFAFTFCFNTVAEYIRQRLREKYSLM